MHKSFWPNTFHAGELQTKGRKLRQIAYLLFGTKTTSSTKPIVIHKTFINTNTRIKPAELMLQMCHTTETSAVRNQLQHQQWLQHDTHTYTERHGGRLYRLPHLHEMDQEAGVWDTAEAEHRHTHTHTISVQKKALNLVQTCRESHRCPAWAAPVLIAHLTRTRTRTRTHTHTNTHTHTHTRAH